MIEEITFEKIVTSKEKIVKKIDTWNYFIHSSITEYGTPTNKYLGVWTDANEDFNIVEIDLSNDTYSGIIKMRIGSKHGRHHLWILEDFYSQHKHIKEISKESFMERLNQAKEFLNDFN